MLLFPTGDISLRNTAASRNVRARWLLLFVAIVLLPISSWAQGGQQGVSLASAPTGTTSETNPEIQVTAPGKVSYRYSLNGAPYSPELPLAKPIRFDGDVSVGGVEFTAGTRALVEFLGLRSTDFAFSEFLDRISFDRLGSQVQVTYLVNGKRVTMEPENILNLRGAGVADLDVAVLEKVPAGPRYELSALSIGGGELVKQPSSDGTRRFVLSLPPLAQAVTLTPVVNNDQTAIVVNGQPSASGQTTVVSAPSEGDVLTLQTVGPDASVTLYVVEVRYDEALAPAEYRSHYLRGFTPESAYISIRNTGVAVVDYKLTFNRKFGLTMEEIVREIQAMEPEYAGESISRKVWRFIKDNRYHFHPLTPARWNDSPALFFNSIGFGYCDDTASLFRHLMSAMGYPARVWGLGQGGHVVAEAFVNNRWEMWDPDLQVYYENHAGLVAGVQELAADPDLITNPLNPLPDTLSAYHPVIADFYATQGDNVIATWYDELPAPGDSSMTLEIPPGGVFEFPDVYDAPMPAMYSSEVPSYANARLIVPEGFSGSLSLPLVIHSIGWSNHPTLHVITKDAAGHWDSQPTVAAWTVDAEPPLTVASQPSGVYNSDEPVTLTVSEAATIYYTLDGSTPTETSSVYTAPIYIDSGASIAFFAVDEIGNRERVRVYGPWVQQVQVELASMTGATAVFVASASGGSGQYEYMFELRDTQNTWSIVQPFGTANTWTWNKSNVPQGSYTVRVCARNLGMTMACGAVAGEVAAAIDVEIVPEAAPVLVNPGDQTNDDGVGSYAETVLADAPVSYWRLAEDGGVAADSAGDNEGSRFGSISATEPGALADGTAAALLNGVNGYIQVADSASLRVAGDLTIELWLNVSLAARQTLISKSYLHEFDLTLETDGRLNFYQGNGSTHESLLSDPGAVAANAWQHIVLTREAATKTVRFYVNGQPKGGGVYVNAPAAGTSALSIGRSGWDVQYVNGRLDEIAVYPAALSAAQINKHYVMRLANGTGTPIELPLAASDANGDPLTYGASGLPPGLTIDSSTGLISGHLTPASVGVHQVVVTASDGSLSHSQAFQWTVTHVNRAPTLNSPANQTHAENTSIALQLAAADLEGDALTFSAIGLPASLAIGSDTGLISGTLGFSSAGTYPVTVTVSDGSASTTGTFIWTVVNTNRAPVLLNPGTQTHSDTWDYPHAVRADGAVAYWRLGESEGSTAIDSVGAQAGTRYGGVALGQPGALVDGNTAMLFNGSNGHVRVANSSVLQVAGDLTIELWLNVSLASRQTLISKNYLREFDLTLETTGALNLYQGNGSTFSNVLSAAGAVAANTWQHVVVTRTAATKTIRFYVNGVAKGSGVYNVVATSGPNPMSIGRSEYGVQHVNGRLDEVAIYPIALTAGQAASHYALRSSVWVPTSVTLQLSATDPDGNALTFGATGLPPGLSVNAATGLISGTLPSTSAGNYEVTATAADGSLSHSQTFTWTVTRTNRAPELTGPGNQTSAEGTSISLSLSASDPNGDALTYSAIGLPASLTLNTSTGVITGTLSFTSAGSYAVTATVSDGSLSTSLTLNWVVTNTNREPVLANPGNQTTGGVPSYAQLVADDAPAAYWRLDETTGSTAGDSANSHSGTLLGGVQLARSGALADGNGAMLLNGSTGYIRVPSSAPLQLAADLTLEMWINVSLAARQTLISKDYLREFELTLETTGHLNLYQGNGSTYANVLSVPGAVTANTWQHVVVTRSAATKTVRFYVNGVAKGVGTYATTPMTGTNVVSIGRARSGVQYLNGRLDEVAIYPAVLSSGRAQAHYETGISPGPGVAVTLQLSGADSDGDPVTYSVVGLPPGLTLDPATGLISGMLFAASAGIHQVTATVSDGSLVSSQTFVWLVGN